MNDAPVLAGIETATLTYAENASATTVTSSLTISDVDNAAMTSATISISSNYQSGADVLSSTNVGSVIGSFNAATGVLALTGVDSLANYQTALRSVKYTTPPDNPSALQRAVTFVVSDATAPSAPVSRSIALTTANDLRCSPGSRAQPLPTAKICYQRQSRLRLPSMITIRPFW